MPRKLTPNMQSIIELLRSGPKTRDQLHAALDMHGAVMMSVLAAMERRELIKWHEHDDSYAIQPDDVDQDA